MQTQQHSESFQSRWGYHPCNYALYCKLKELHRWYWQTMYDFHAWHRWWRKEEQNRNGPEPKFCPHFVIDTVWYRPLQRGDVTHYRVYPKRVIDHEIVELFLRARTPNGEPVLPFDQECGASIEALHEKVSEYFQS